MLARLVVPLLVAAAAPAQCAKPKIPEHGLPLKSIAGVLVTYGDGTRTKGDLILPSTTPPSCGWPLVVWVHPLGADRSSHHPERQSLAAHGFAVWAYDVRGQGEHAVLNPSPAAGSLIDGGPEHVDLGEQILFVHRTYAGTVGTRTAVAGSSQGGAHAWAAAAFSERKIEVPGRPAVQFPRVHAVAAADLAPEPILYRIKDRRQFHWASVDLLVSTIPGLRLHRSQFDLILNAFPSQDAEYFATELETDPGRAVLPGLRTTRVPILANHSWLDSVGSARPLLEVWRQLPAATPKRMVLHTTGIHSSPGNLTEIRFQDLLRRRWFDRFLWDSTDPVETEAPITVALLPTDPGILADANSLWPRRQLATWPQPAATLFLHGSGRLDAAASAASAPLLIDHQIQSIVTAQNYIVYAGLRTKDMILRYAPAVGGAYRSAPLASDLELLGSPRVSLAVMPGAASFSLSAALYARLPGRSDRWMLTSESTRVVEATPGEPQRVEFELAPIGTVLPSGTVLELALRNHWLTEAPYQDAILVTPEFTSGKLAVLHEAAPQQSLLHLPLRPLQTGLASDLTSISSTQPVAVPLRVDAGTARAGVYYAVLAGTSGHMPVGSVPSIQSDAFMQAVLGLGNSTLTQNFIGRIGNDGYASALFAAQLAAPLPPQLVGTRLSFGGLIFDPGGLLATNPIDVVIR